MTVPDDWITRMLNDARRHGHLPEGPIVANPRPYRARSSRDVARLRLLKDLGKRP